jgi:hypothetical protein
VKDYDDYLDRAESIFKTREAAAEPLVRQREACVYAALQRFHLDGGINPPPFSLADNDAIDRLANKPENAHLKTAIAQCDASVAPGFANIQKAYDEAMKALDDEAYRAKVKADWMIITDGQLASQAGQFAQQSWDVSSLPGPARPGPKAIIFPVKSVVRVHRHTGHLLLLFESRGQASKLIVGGKLMTLSELAGSLRGCQMYARNFLYLAADRWKKDGAGEDAITHVFFAEVLRIVDAKLKRATITIDTSTATKAVGFDNLTAGRARVSLPITIETPAGARRP